MVISNYPANEIILNGQPLYIESSANMGDLLIATLLTIAIALFVAKWFAEVLRK